MEITKCLQDDILKIQNELKTAIQNHQVLVLRQQVSPNESIKTQIEEVQRHIICLGESQKILVTRLQNELQSQSPCVNNKHKTPHQQRPYIKSETHDKFRTKPRSQNLSRSLLIKDINKEQSLVKSLQASDSDISEQNNSVLKERHLSVDSSSEENRTPCQSPVIQNDDHKNRGVKRTLSETHRTSTKRPKTTLQAAPRPSSPVPARSNAVDSLSCSSDESLDSLSSQQQSESIVDFALSLGLVTNDVYSKVIKKKSERRKRRVSHQHHLYNNLWDLTVAQKRTRVKEPEPENGEEAIRECPTPDSDADGLCFICQKPGTGELRECRVCQTGCHVTCVINDICPACTHRAYPKPSSPLISEKKKELEQLRLNNRELHKSVSKLREKAKELSASLLMQTATMNQLSADRDKIDDSIKRVKDFLVYFKGPSKPSTTVCETSGPPIATT